MYGLWNGLIWSIASFSSNQSLLYVIGSVSVNSLRMMPRASSIFSRCVVGSMPIM